MDEQAIRKVLDFVDEDKAVKLLCDLIDIPSRTGDERPCAEFLVSHMDSLGLETRLQVMDDYRANALGWLRGQKGRSVLTLNGHLDTSCAGEEDEDYPMTGPLAPGLRPKSYVKDGRVFGLGSFNMKGGVAAAVTAVDALRRSGVELAGDIMVAGVSGEIEKSPVKGAMRSYTGRHYKGMGVGTRYLLTHGGWTDYAVICEPSGSLYVFNARTGYLFVKITVKGRMGYIAAKGPLFRGVNAIEKAYAVVRALEEWAPKYAEAHRYDSGIGTINANVNLGAIESGWPYKPGYCPAICNLYVDLRTTPAFTAPEALAELKGLLDNVARENPDLDYDLEVYCSSDPPLATDPKSELVQTALRARQLVTGEWQERFPPEPASCWDDGILYRQFGIPAVSCGPSGGTSKASPAIWAEGEHVAISDLVGAAKIYVAIALELCG